MDKATRRGFSRLFWLAVVLIGIVITSLQVLGGDLIGTIAQWTLTGIVIVGIAFWLPHIIWLPFSLIIESQKEWEEKRRQARRAASGDPPK